MKINLLLKQYGLTMIGVLIGAGLGYIYYSYVGCANGSCMITSHPINAMVYGSVMIGLLFNMFQKK